MSDDLDNLLRAAMKTLDEQVPSGYFEALPNQTLARLEGSSMQHGTGMPGLDKAKGSTMVPPPMDPDTQQTAKVDGAVEPRERDEDSGLHDIRNLAQSTKQRLSSLRVTQNPPMSDDDILASSSGSFKNIALPQPAHMVSLPELADLPSKKEVLAAEKAAKRSPKASQSPVIADDASVSLTAMATTAAPATAAPDVAAVPARSGFSLPSQQHKRSKAPLFAVVGLGVAAAAGYVVYTQVLTTSENKAAPAVAQIQPADRAEVAKAPEATAAISGAAGSAAPAAEPQKSDEELKAEAALEQAKEEAAKAEADAAAAGATNVAAPVPHNAKKTTAKGKKDDHKVEVDLDDGKQVETKPEDKKPVDPKSKTGTGSGAGDGEAQPNESFDQLLKEAGVEEKKTAKPKLEKKSLTTDDFKSGMATIASKAQACYKGTQGTASVKLTIAPSGAVSKVTVGGAFAGKPEASCVEAAVKSAKFPAWDGGPQSFTYAYMLSD